MRELESRLTDMFSDLETINDWVGQGEISLNQAEIQLATHVMAFSEMVNEYVKLVGMYVPDRLESAEGLQQEVVLLKNRVTDLDSS